MMRINQSPEAIAKALSASLEFRPENDAIVFSFNDCRLRYELHIHNDGTALLACDPKEPIQACPMLEYSFRYTDIVIGKSAYCMNGQQVAIEFYDGDVSQHGIRLIMSWILDGYWYLWANANSMPYMAERTVNE